MTRFPIDGGQDTPIDGGHDKGLVGICSFPSGLESRVAVAQG
jgi:hypothetical protein